MSFQEFDMHEIEEAKKKYANEAKKRWVIPKHTANAKRRLPVTVRKMEGFKQRDE